ncbi:hypothetical protein WN48_02307 [Eufriesea mexicana]|uniref:Uncharacterized protein n=1 Tax=Eufriesea mexicana TaxID=516756 RepID=A0A310SLB3_9HYME|nr:hypothetical protein WN48_02307 [Eufriesea mexicana]
MFTAPDKNIKASRYPDKTIFESLVDPLRIYCARWKPATLVILVFRGSLAFPAFCIGDKFFLCENKILCESDYEERLVFANMAVHPPSTATLAHIKRQVIHLQPQAKVERKNQGGGRGGQRTEEQTRCQERQREKGGDWGGRMSRLCWPLRGAPVNLALPDYRTNGLPEAELEEWPRSEIGERGRVGRSNR